jgi:LPS sulfotransferase NodH
MNRSSPTLLARTDEVIADETRRVHHASRRHSRLAARGAPAADNVALKGDGSVMPDTTSKATIVRPDAIDLIGPSFDNPSDEPAAKTLIICAAPRTGSREMARLLMAARIGVAHEYFNPNYARIVASRWGLTADVLSPEHIEEYIAELRRRRSGGGVFATNLQFPQFQACLRNKQGRAFFKGAVVIHLFRADAVRQFVSLHRAAETGRYDFSDRPTLTRLDAGRLLDKEYLMKLVRELALQDAGFRSLFVLSGIHPIFIESEEFFRRPQSIVEKIGEALGVSIHYERLKEAIAVSKPYEYGREARNREELLLDIMERSAFES